MYFAKKLSSKLNFVLNDIWIRTITGRDLSVQRENTIYNQCEECSGLNDFVEPKMKICESPISSPHYLYIQMVYLKNHQKNHDDFEKKKTCLLSIHSEYTHKWSHTIIYRIAYIRFTWAMCIVYWLQPYKTNIYHFQFFELMFHFHIPNKTLSISFSIYSSNGFKYHLARIPY